jgi:hypothetical protein
MRYRRALFLWLACLTSCIASEDVSRLTGGAPRAHDGGMPPPPPRFGTGSDGGFDSGGSADPNHPVILNSTHTPVSGSAGSSSITVGDGSKLAANNLVLLHDTQGANAGHWELARIQSVSGNNVTLTGPLAHDYPGTDKCQLVTVPQYTDFIVRNGDNVTGPNWDGNSGGIVAFSATGTVTVAGSLYQGAAGFRGPNHNPGCPQTYQCMPGNSGESATGPSQPSSKPNGAGGGGGGVGECNEGGGGSYGTAGTGSVMGGSAATECMPSSNSPGEAGAVSGDADLRTTILFGGAGGEGGADGDSIAPGHGGNGGGIIMIFAAQVNVSGSIDASGDDGQDGAGNDRCATGCGSGGGAGGAGGAIYFDTKTLSITGNVTALGGKGGNCSCNGVSMGWHQPPMSYPSAGGGGSGRIAAHGASVTGTTNPSLFAD